MRAIQLMPSGYGHYKLTITYRNKQYTHTTDSMQLIDAYKSEKGEHRLTPIKASKLLWQQVKKANNLR